jgi:hypothetical protein
MIRPVTCVCFVLACASGLYLYQSKHRVQVLDREIEKTVRVTDSLREQTRVLHAEWTLMNDPQRLQVLADQFLSLKTVAPGQFTNLAELDNRLPPVRPPDPVKPDPQLPVIAQAPDATPVEEPEQPLSVAVMPTPPIPPSAVIAAPLPRVVEHKPSPPRPVIAEIPSVKAAVNVPRPQVVTEPLRPSPPRVMPVSLPAQPAPAATTGSSLGMARGAVLPPPQPMPVSASQWVSSPVGGGG